MVSVVGRATAVATTDREGRYTLRELPFGPYVLSVHSRGYWQSRGRTVQLTNQKLSVPEIQLAKVGAERAAALPASTPPKATAAPQTQLAGFGVELTAADTSQAPAAPDAGEKTAKSDEPAEGEGETAWRLRHLPRSIESSGRYVAVSAKRKPVKLPIVRVATF